jgi:hypothetical protein
MRSLCAISCCIPLEVSAGYKLWFVCGTAASNRHDGRKQLNEQRVQTAVAQLHSCCCKGHRITRNHTHLLIGRLLAPSQLKVTTMGSWDASTWWLAAAAACAAAGSEPVRLRRAPPALLQRAPPALLRPPPLLRLLLLLGTSRPAMRGW